MTPHCRAELPLTTIRRTRLPFDQTKSHEFGDLTADGAVVASDAPGEFNHANRPQSLRQDQEREQGSIKLYSGFPDEQLISIGAVDDGHDIKDGIVKLPEHFPARCIMHGY